MRREQRAWGRGARVWEGRSPELKTICLRKITSFQFWLGRCFGITTICDRNAKNGMDKYFGFSKGGCRYYNKAPGCLSMCLCLMPLCIDTLRVVKIISFPMFVDGAFW
ncbi:hypothetical protein CEXT_508141 [Caerostris extrusa]|uniref:Uncharacterized protein n=1 Tax=Caerostris extrusa TaxID=172846 RepID=A0AAV4XXH8_CAEEX|nr:hypothetical protein CEXT_508141 [Caerostris extrusa]